MLGLPLTFALSQDQTLQLRCLNRTEFRRTAIWISSLLLFSLYRYSVFKDQQLGARRTLLLGFVEPGDADYLFFSDRQLFFSKSLSLSFSLPNQRDQVDDSSDFEDLVKDVFSKISLFFGPANCILRQQTARS